MIRKIIATAALSGTLALGAAGVAGATTTTTGGATGASGANHAKLCAKAPAVLARMDKLNTRYQAWLPKAEQREATAKKDHHTKAATRIQNRIDRLQKLQAKGAAVVKKIEAACPGVTAGSGSSSSAPANG